MSEKRCAKIMDHFRRLYCQRTGTIERDGAWWCRTHDPEAVAARDRKREEKYNAERREEDRTTADMGALATRLGCGRVYYESTVRPRGYQRALVIAEGDVLALLARLDEAEDGR